MACKLLTLVVPSYNMEAYLPKCLGSLEVSPELMERLEVLVVNDGSKDRTSEIAHSFAAKWPDTFKVIDKENGNYGSCINAALSVAQGEYVKVLDADDWFDTEVFAKYLQRLAEEASKTVPPDLVLNDFDFVDVTGETYRRVNYAFIAEKGNSLDAITFDEPKTMWMHAVAYRTENLRRIGYCQTEGISYTDQEWIGLPMSTVRTLVYIPGVLYKYLNGRDGQTCQEAVYTKMFPQQMQICLGLVDAYGKVLPTLPGTNANYLRRHLHKRVRTIYDKAVFSRRHDLQVALQAFDLKLKGLSPELYSLSDGWSLSRSLRFRHVHEWRRHGHNRTIGFWAFRLYCSWVPAIRRLAGRSGKRA